MCAHRDAFRHASDLSFKFAYASSISVYLDVGGSDRRGGGGQTMPDGTEQCPGGWNRISIEVDDLDSMLENLKKAGCTFRNELVTGVGGSRY